MLKVKDFQSRQIFRWKIPFPHNTIFSWEKKCEWTFFFKHLLLLSLISFTCFPRPVQDAASLSHDPTGNANIAAAVTVCQHTHWEEG